MKKDWKQRKVKSFFRLYEEYKDDSDVYFSENRIEFRHIKAQSCGNVIVEHMIDYLGQWVTLREVRNNAYMCKNGWTWHEEWLENEKSFEVAIKEEDFLI